MSWDNGFEEPKNQMIPKGTYVSLHSDWSGNCYMVTETIKGFKGKLVAVECETLRLLETSGYHNRPFNYSYGAFKAQRWKAIKFPSNLKDKLKKLLKEA